MLKWLMTLLFLAVVGCGQPATQVWYLNFQGQTLVPAGVDDAPTGKSSIVRWPVVFKPYVSPLGTEAQEAAEIKRLLEAMFYGYNIAFTTDKPSGKYNEVLFSGLPRVLDLSSLTAGVSPLDCEDKMHQDIVLVFADWYVDLYNPTPTLSKLTMGMASTAAHEIGHSLGLQHTSNQYDLMYQYLNSATQFSLGRVLPPDTCETGPIQKPSEVLGDHLGFASPKALPQESYTIEGPLAECQTF